MPVEYVSVGLSPGGLVNLVIMVVGHADARSPCVAADPGNLVNMVLDAWFCAGGRGRSFCWRLQCAGGGVWLVSRHLRRLDPGVGRTPAWSLAPNGPHWCGCSPQPGYLSAPLPATLLRVHDSAGQAGDVAVAANAVLLNFLMLISTGWMDCLCGGSHRRAIGGVTGRCQEAIVLNLGFLLIALAFTLAFAPGGPPRLIRHYRDMASAVSRGANRRPWLVAMLLLAVWCSRWTGLYRRHRPGDARNSMLVAVFAGLLSHLVVLPGCGCGGPVAGECPDGPVVA